MQQLVKVRLRISSLSPWVRRDLLIFIIIIFCLYFHWLVVKWVIAQKQHPSTCLWFGFCGFFFSFSIKIASKVFTGTFLIVAQRHRYCDRLWRDRQEPSCTGTDTGGKAPDGRKIQALVRHDVSKRDRKRESTPGTTGNVGLQVLSLFCLLFVFFFCLFLNGKGI